MKIETNHFDTVDRGYCGGDRKKMILNISQSLT